jgi:hypothetical protein
MFKATKFTNINIQIMNVYECNGKNIFMRLKMESSIQRGDSRDLSPNENILTFARTNIHYLFI